MNRSRFANSLRELRQKPELDAILLTGGTGIGSRDQTFETISADAHQNVAGLR